MGYRSRSIHHLYLLKSLELLGYELCSRGGLRLTAGKTGVAGRKIGESSYGDGGGEGGHHRDSFGSKVEQKREPRGTQDARCNRTVEAGMLKPEPEMVVPRRGGKNNDFEQG